MDRSRFPYRFLMRVSACVAPSEPRNDPTAGRVGDAVMSLISFAFWTLVLVTALVAARWGAMIGLIGFVFALMIGAVAISRLAPPKSGVINADRHLVSETHVAEEAAFVRVPRF